MGVVYSFLEIITVVKFRLNHADNAFHIVHHTQTIDSNKNFHCGFGKGARQRRAGWGRLGEEGGGANPHAHSFPRTL